MNYGVHHRYYARPLAGWPPAQFPLGPALRGLGQAICLDQGENSIACNSPDCTYGDCGSTAKQLTAGALCLDQAQNQIACNSPECTYGDCIAQMPASSSLTAGAATGSILLYQGVWQVTLTLNVNTIISRVSQALQSSGVLQVVQQQNTGGALTVGNFNVALTLQVTGAGFNLPADAGSIVDHAYYTVTGHMPVSSGTVLQSAAASQGGNVPVTIPGAGSSASTTSMSAWFQSNAAWIIAAVVAAIALPRLME